MNTDIPPVERSARSGIVDETILKISGELFEVPIFGYGIAILINFLYIYYWYKKATFFSLLYFIFLFWIIIRVIQIKILGM